MATVPFPGVWSPDTQFTGNAVFVMDENGVVWLAANSTSSGAALYSSPAGAYDFTLVVSIPNVESPDLAFDPAIAVDSSGNLHIVGQIAVGGTVVLQKFTYTPTTATLSGPFPLTTGGVVGSDYDIVALADGDCYVATCLLTGTTETIEGLMISAAGAIVSTDVLVSQPTFSGNRYGSVSLWTPDGASVEIYLCYEPKAFQFDDTTVSIALITRSSADVISAPTVLNTFSARYVAGRLTVLGYGTARYLCQAYYSQSGFSLISNAMFGYLAAGTTTWSFYALAGTITASIIQPVLSISPDGLVLALVSGNTNSMNQGAAVKLYDLNPTGWVLTPRTDFPYPAVANWLRGSKSALPASMPWGFLAQQASTGVARFYTGFNAPPSVVLTPLTETCQRGLTYTLDASGSSDMNMDTLVFTWTCYDPTGMAVFTPDGETATIELPLSIGPAAQMVTVTVSVVDVSSTGNPLNTPVTATSTLTYPLVPAPVIDAMASIDAARNSEVSIDPTITVSPYTTPTYAWIQTAGTQVPILSSTLLPTLLIETNGAAVVGETLTYQLTVNDGVNTPVSASFEVIVAARVSTGETQVLARATRAGNMSDRNSVQTWSAPVASSTTTQFTSVKRAPIVNPVSQAGSYILISRASVTVQREGATYHALTPNPADTILDAVHSFWDETLLLTSAGEILQMIPNATLTDTDNANESIKISSFTSVDFTRIAATPPFVGQRVLLLTGSSGCLLLAIDSSLGVTGSVFFSSATGDLLYGGSDVQWISWTGIESLHSGILLVGTTDSEGNSYETEIQIANRTVISVWDSSLIRNQSVESGQILFQPVDSYSGFPMPPVLETPTYVSDQIVLTWTQPRPDLLTGYLVMLQTSTGSVAIAQVSNGMIETAAVNLPAGATYSFSIVAQSLDGSSAPSNVMQISI
jgi:hypothetical protein